MPLSDGSELSFDGLVIATGARPRRLPYARLVQSLHTVDDALALRGAL